jgi:hypothetical protein
LHLGEIDLSDRSEKCPEKLPADGFFHAIERLHKEVEE